MKLWLGIAVTVLAILYLIRGIDWDEMVLALRNADLAWIFAGAMLVFLGQLVRAFRWQSLFNHERRPAIRDCFAIMNVGYLVSTILPFRLGDPYRAFAIDRNTSAGLSESLATIMVERILDLLSIIVLMAAFAPALGSSLFVDQYQLGEWLSPKMIQIIGFALIGISYLGLVVLASASAQSAKLVDVLLRRIGLRDEWREKCGALVEGFAEGLRPLRRPGRALKALLWSLTVWLVAVWYYLAFARAFTFDLSFAQASFVMATLAIFAIVPSTPGYVGVFHAGVVMSLVTVMKIVEKPEALSYAVASHATVMIVLIILGVLGLRMMGMGREDLRKGLSESADLARS